MTKVVFLLATIFVLLPVLALAAPAFTKSVALTVHNALFGYMHRAGFVLAVNDFSKEEKVAFDEVLEGFHDALVLSRNVSVYRTEPTSMERARDIFWRPQPYIAQSFDGDDATNNFKRYTQMSVPATLGYQKHVPLELGAKELRDALQEKRLGQAAMQKLASDINIAVMDTACNYGSLVVKRTSAASGFDDLAACEAIMNEQGVGMDPRYAALSTRDYNGMASNLAARSTMTGKPTTAYEKAFVGTVASFETYKLDYANRLAAAGGGGSLTIDTRSSASNYYVPRATSTGTAGQTSNVDNRFQTITISSTTGVAAGDCFTIADVLAVHHITKRSTAQLKTFRVVSVPSSTTLVITPPIISAQGGSDAEAAYQNVSVTASATAAITFLNTVAAYVNPFWHKDAIELLPGSYAVPPDAGAKIMRASTDQGIEVLMSKWYTGETMKTRYRWDIFFGTNYANPEMGGVMLFSQT